MGIRNEGIVVRYKLAATCVATLFVVSRIAGSTATAEDGPSFGPRLIAPDERAPTRPVEAPSKPNPGDPNNLPESRPPVPTFRTDRSLAPPAPEPELVRPDRSRVTPVGPRTFDPASSERHEVRRAASDTTSTRAPLQVDIGEAFANRWFGRRETREAPVRDFVLQADVQGWQSTTTDVTLDFLESPTAARFDFRAVGETNSDTLGYTNDATIRTLGRHHFTVTKPVLVHGDMFLVKQASAYVQPSNTTVGMATRFDGLPLIGDIAQRTAQRKAAEARPAAEKIAADRLAERLLPRINTDVDGELQSLNEDLAGRRAELEKSELWPTRTATCSTDTFVTLSAWYAKANGAVGPLPETGRAQNDEVRLAVHESLVAPAITRLDLSGRTLTKADLEGGFRTLPEWIEIEKPELADEDQPGAGMADLVKFVLDDDLPVRVEFTKSHAYVTIRLRIRPAIGGDLPAHDIRLGIDSILDEQGLAFITDSVDVSRVDGVDDESSRMLAKLLGEQLRSSLPRIRVPRWIPMPESMKTANGVGSLQITGLVADEGWFVVRVR